MASESKFRKALEQYKSAGVEYVPVRTPQGKFVHVTTMHTPKLTACDRKSKRLMVAFEPVNCPGCLAAIHLPVKRRRRR